VRLDTAKAAYQFVSREGETNETSETGFLINLLIIND
jgi:hypothetical protein